VLLAAPAPFVHRAILYGDDVEVAAVVTEQLFATVERGDPAVAVLDVAVRRAVEDRLGATAELVHFRDLADIHADTVEKMIANYLAMVDGLLRGGRLSTIVQYDPTHPHDGTDDFCYRVEAAVNVAAAQRSVDNTCLYDLRAVSAADVAAVRRTHPWLVLGGVAGPNPAIGDPPALAVVGPAGLRGMRTWVREHAALLPHDVLEQLVLVVNEAVTAVIGSSGGVWVHMDRTPDRFAVLLSWATDPMIGTGVLDGRLPVPDHRLHDLALVARDASDVSVRAHATAPTTSRSTLEITVSP
jgi:MEDS: MEthanogen/methylotroph, DcmR Sensory domain